MAKAVKTRKSGVKKAKAKAAKPKARTSVTKKAVKKPAGPKATAKKKPVAKKSATAKAAPKKKVSVSKAVAKPKKAPAKAKTGATKPKKAAAKPKATAKVPTKAKKTSLAKPKARAAAKPKPAAKAALKAASKAKPKATAKSKAAASPAADMRQPVIPPRPVAPPAPPPPPFHVPDIGDKAPDFLLPGDDGAAVSLAGLSGKKVVLYFYPKDDTPGCTIEAIAFSKEKTAFEAANAVVLGVSRDSIADHCKFRDKHNLTVRLISDETGEMLRAYGVWVEKNLYGRTYMGIERTTLLIDGSGTIRKVWRKVKVEGHADEVLAAVKDI